MSSRIKQPANTVIKLYPTELLNSSGVSDQRPTGSPRYDTYTFRGDEHGETWGPHFMYHGFRYLVIYGLKSAPYTPICLRQSASDLQ
jgi:alpha-L-rhamnosidase